MKLDRRGTYSAASAPVKPNPFFFSFLQFTLLFLHVFVLSNSAAVLPNLLSGSVSERLVNIASLGKIQGEGRKREDWTAVNIEVNAEG